MISINLIKNEYSNVAQNDSTVKAIFYFFYNNSFNCQCHIRDIVNTKPSRIRHLKAQRLERKKGVLIGNHSSIGPGLIINHFEGLIVGDRVIIGDNCNIYQHVTLGQKNGQYPTIGNNVTIYPGATIVGGIHIGDNCIIAPNSVVVFDADSNTTISGIPAKPIKSK